MWHEVCDTMGTMEGLSPRSTSALARGVAYLFGPELVYELFDGRIVGAMWRDGRGRSFAAEAIVGRELVGFVSSAAATDRPRDDWAPGLRAVLRASEHQSPDDDATLVTGRLVEVSACGQTNAPRASRARAAGANGSGRSPGARLAPTIPDPSSMTRIHVLAQIAPGR